MSSVNPPGELSKLGAVVGTPNLEVGVRREGALGNCALAFCGPRRSYFHNYHHPLLLFLQVIFKNSYSI